MPTAHAKIAVALSYCIMAPLGAALILYGSFSLNVSVATARAILFVVIMACVHLAGYVLYVQQYNPKPAEAGEQDASIEFSPLYWPALQFGVILQAIIGLLTVLILDFGESFRVFEVAFLGHWAGIILIVARRPFSPTKVDIVFIRWGTPLLMMATGLIACPVWKIIGDSDISGWQRLWIRMSHR